MANVVEFKYQLLQRGIDKAAAMYYIVVQMYIKKSKVTIKGKTYINHALVESVRTPNGPRQKTICSLGSLKPRPAHEWKNLAHKIQDALDGQQNLFNSDHDQVNEIVERVCANNKKESLPHCKPLDDAVVSVAVDNIEVEQTRTAGALHIANTFYDRLGIDAALKACAINQRTRMVIRFMVHNRLIEPSSEHAMPSWVDRAAVHEVIGEQLGLPDSSRLYRAMDKLYENREKIEGHIRTTERSLFGLSDTVFLYDLTSHYFEGQCPTNPKAKRGYSRDKRGDCKQIVVGLVLDYEGFPIAHEVFDGNRRDSTTVEEILAALKKRAGKLEGATVVVDRGMAFQENLDSIKKAGCEYIVAGRQPERNEWLADISEHIDFEKVIRLPSPNNPFQKKSPIDVKLISRKDETVVLCRSEARIQKDKAIREKAEMRLLADIDKLAKRIDDGKLKRTDKIHQAIGRLKERHSRVARYYQITYNPQTGFTGTLVKEKRTIAEELDGTYILKTSRDDMSADEIWRTYILLTRVENAFRTMKSPLSERPIFHHLPHRVETHIFLCVLAYHIVAAVEKKLRDAGEYTSWATVRRDMSTHQIVTVCLPMADGAVMRIRKATKPESHHEYIYNALEIKSAIIAPQKSLHRPGRAVVVTK